MDLSEIQMQLKQDPGNPLFAEYADTLRRDRRYNEAMEVCYRGLSANPSIKRGRLVLARVYYEQLYWPFAIREVEQLYQEFPESETVKRLLEALAPERKEESSEKESVDIKDSSDKNDTHPKAEESDEETVAEAEFEIDAFDLLEEDD